MEITEVRVKLMDEPSERLQGFCSITIDDSFVVRDLKIIAGKNGPFVAMPSRKLMAHCAHCGGKNYLRATHCNECGNLIADDRRAKDQDGRVKLYADIAHPINAACRETIEKRVLREFQLELYRSKLPGYRSRYDDFDDKVEVEASPSAPEPSNASQAGDEPGRAVRARIQPAEKEPRRPHRSRLHRDGKTRPPATNQDQFGAGIWEQNV